MQADDILFQRERIPPKAFGLLSDAQLKSLDLKKFCSQQILYCIRGGIGDDKTIQRRLSALSSEQLVAISKMEQVDVFRFFPMSWFKNLSFSKMTRKQIDWIFCNREISKNEQKQRIAIVNPKAINEQLSELNRYFLCNLSDTQIRHLDYSKIGKLQMENIFSSDNPKEEIARRIALVPSRFIQLILKETKDQFLLYFTKEQIFSLDSEQINSIYSYWKLTEHQGREIIVKLPVYAIDALIYYGFFDVLNHITRKQLSEIDVQNIPERYLTLLFPPLNPAKFFQDCEYFLQISKGENLHIYQNRVGGGVTFITDTNIKKIIEQRKDTCLKNFKILKNEQFAKIKNKVSPEVLEFLERSNECQFSIILERSKSIA